MSVFKQQLAQRNPELGSRRWLLVPCDQLSDRIGPLSREHPQTLGIALIESRSWASRRPYHRQKLALLFANMRHFALEQAARGVAVRYVVTDDPHQAALRRLAREVGPFRVMEPAERELRVEIQPLVSAGQIEVLPHEGWLTTPDDFAASHKGGPPWRMDSFYRFMRKRTGLLMEAGKPVGGRLSFDADCREPWQGDPPAPEPPTFPRDPIKEEVAELVDRDFGHHPGRVDLDHLPATHEDAEAAWAWALGECLPSFCPYEDAMSRHSSGLFHTRISPLLNIHRLLPERVLSDAADAEIPLADKEAFVRQTIGWREYVRHVHLASDGFRALPKGTPVEQAPGDAGYERWAGKAWPAPEPPPDVDGGAAPRLLGGDTPLPPAYWGRPSGLACLDRVVSDVWREAYSHHITRLMILSNIATLLDVSPRELTDWFWVAYADAYDWAVEPNVLGMGTFAVGSLMSTKPYVSGTPYILRMSDYCETCGFDARRNCPISSLYWAFLARHAAVLAGNARMGTQLSSARKRDRARQERDDLTLRTLRDALLAGGVVSPADFPWLEE